MAEGLTLTIIEDRELLDALQMVRAHHVLGLGKVCDIAGYQSCVQASMLTKSADKREKLMNLARDWEQANG